MDGGGGAFMLMHETSMHENYDLKWSQTWPLFFWPLGGPGGKPSSFYSFCFFFLPSPKREKREWKIKKKIGKRKTEKREQKKNTFFLLSTSLFFGGFFPARHFVCSTIGHRHFFVLIQATAFCVYDNSTQLVSYFRLCDTAIFCVYFFI